MIFDRADTIAAIATPVGTGGVGIVRLSGSTAIAIAGVVLGRDPSALIDRKVTHGWVHDCTGNVVDEVLSFVMRGPKSFTGEDVAEIHGHGGAVNLARILGVVLAAGARTAEPGEFTRRAFENGRIDLIRAEAIAGIIEAQSERARRVSQAQLAGKLGETLQAVSERIAQLLAEVEARIDFPEEGIEFAPLKTIGLRARALADPLAKLADTFRFGKAMRDGVDVAIVGPINGGKSSIFNMLLGETRTLVDASAGTTRDYIEAKTVWNGLPITLIDTAGIRDAASHVEQQGIVMGQQRAQHADLQIVVHPVVDGRPPDLQGLGSNQIGVVSKIDLLTRPLAGSWIGTSSHTDQGFDQLKQVIAETALGRPGESDESLAVTNERQYALICHAKQSLCTVADAVDLPLEVLAVDLRDALNRLGEVAGQDVDESVLDALFGQFCIGK